MTMRESIVEATAHQYDRMKHVISRKLGRCSRCMRSCARGMVAGWTVTYAAIAFIPEGPVQNTALLLALPVALSFTLLLLAHLVTLMVRIVRQPEPLPVVNKDLREDPMDRRSVLLRLGSAAVWTAAFGFGLLLPRSAIAEALCNCQYQCANVCHSGDTQVYSRCYCRDDNGNSCGPGSTDTGTGVNTCPG